MRRGFSGSVFFRFKRVLAIRERGFGSEALTKQEQDENIWVRVCMRVSCGRLLLSTSQLVSGLHNCRFEISSVRLGIQPESVEAHFMQQNLVIAVRN